MSDNFKNFNSVHKFQFYLDFETCMKTHQLCIHQEAEEDSDSEGTAGSTLDSTYECISSLHSTAAPTVKEGMNDTMVLVARLDNAGLDSPAPALNSNSPIQSRFTFVTKCMVGFVELLLYCIHNQATIGRDFSIVPHPPPC